MGCTKSKLDDSVCLKDETSDMHTTFINQHGLASYYSVMGMPPEGPSGTEMTDSSENFNIGFVNVEEKTTVDNQFYGLGVSDILEVCIGFLFILYISKLIYKRIMKRKEQARANKNLEMKESCSRWHKHKFHHLLPHTKCLKVPPMKTTPMQYALAKMHENPKAMIPIFPDYLID